MAHRSHLSNHQNIHIERVYSVEVGSDSRTVVHPHATLVYFSSGEAVIWCGTQFHVKGGDIFAIPEGQAHYVQSTQDGSAWVLSFCTSCMSSEVGRALISICQSPADGLGKLRSLQPALQTPFEQHLSMLQEELQGNAPFRDLAINGHLALLTSYILRASPSPVHPYQQGTSLCAEALAFIHSQALEGISLEDVAAAIHRSVSHTASLVKKETGRTVIEWITYARMATARELLTKTNESIEAIALRVGFSGTSHFYRVFKKTHSTTPAAWRRAHQHINRPEYFDEEGS